MSRTGELSGKLQREEAARLRAGNDKEQQVADHHGRAASTSNEPVSELESRMAQFSKRNKGGDLIQIW